MSSIWKKVVLGLWVKVNSTLKTGFFSLSTSLFSLLFARNPPLFIEDDKKTSGFY